jgi:transposase-like protein
LAQAIEAEVESFLEQHRELRDEAGRARLVRNGYLPEREVQTGIGPVSVKAPRVHDRAVEGEKTRFHSGILPKYLRRSASLEELIPWLYLKGVSTGDFQEALSALLGGHAPGLSASTVSRLKSVWSQEFAAWQKRDLSAQRYIYLWVDGVYFQVRMEQSKHCVLIVIGATEDGKKSSSPSVTATERVRRRGRKFCSTLKLVGCWSTPSSPSVTAAWASGKHCPRFTA